MASPFGSSEMQLASVILVVVLVVPAVVALILFFWGRRLAKKRSGWGWRITSWFPLGGLASQIIGNAWALVILLRTIGAAQKADNPEKSVVLSDGIATAMNALGMFAVPGWIVLLASLVAFAIGTLMRPTDASVRLKRPLR